MNELQSYISYLKHEKRYSDHTIIAYDKDLKRFFGFLKLEHESIQLVDIRELHIRNWLVHLKSEGHSAATIKHYLSCIKSFFRYLKGAQIIENNPSSNLSSPKIPKRLPQYLKDNEIQSLFEDVRFADDWHGRQEKLILELFYATGMRRGELVGLRDKDIDVSACLIKVLGKGSKERLIPISEGMLADLQEWMEIKKTIFTELCDSLFITAKGKPIYAGMVYQLVKKHFSDITTLSQKSPHILRHTFATQLSNQGANMKAIKDLMGHASLASTQVYTHNNIEKLKKIYQSTHPRGGDPKLAKDKKKDDT